MEVSKLTFIYAPMNSGKSSQLQMKAYNLKEFNIPHVILKSSIDTRDSHGVVHSRPIGDTPCLIIKPTENIYNLITKYIRTNGKINCILVDEAQFLTEKQVNQLTDIVDYLNIDVTCYGLRTDFRTKLFPGSKRLFEVADVLEEIKSTCKCGNKTLFNARIDKDKNIVTSGSQIEVGGEDKYVIMCRKCYKERLKNSKL